MRSLILFVFLFLLTGCMHTRIHFDDSWDPKSKPTYTDHFDYVWLGFQGQSALDLQKVCMDQKILGFQSQRTFEDGLITLVSLGIITPLTVKVWCGEGT